MRLCLESKIHLIVLSSLQHLMILSLFRGYEAGNNEIMGKRNCETTFGTRSSCVRHCLTKNSEMFAVRHRSEGSTAKTAGWDTCTRVCSGVSATEKFKKKYICVWKRYFKFF